MKKIKIEKIGIADKTSIFTKQRKHHIFLGNGITVYFSDLKDAKRFLTKTNEFYNQKLFEINSIYIDVFIEYRKAWFYFFNVYDRKLNIKSENNIFSEFAIIDSKITLMTARSHFENGSSIVHQGFRLIFEILENITKKLIELYKQKKSYAEAHQIRAIKSRIEIVSMQIENYGKNII